ncbi:DNA polymerase ligase N-terminal domain-containing protein [Chloroflexota bacterium]
MALEEYKEKRDSKKTEEPAGKRQDTGKSRFIVQEHHARHLHYDFRLEMEGVLKSWAVPKGVPLEPGIRRLAVQVEDHPVDYISFEGTIPEGEYGAGTVEIWDGGEYSLTKRSSEKQLEFILKGGKLSGTYVLLNTGGKNWMLLKKKTQ